MQEIHVRDKFILHGEGGDDLTVRVVNINYYRPPEVKYAIEIFDSDGNLYGDDVVFVGDDFFSKNNIERVQ